MHPKLIELDGLSLDLPDRRLARAARTGARRAAFCSKAAWCRGSWWQRSTGISGRFDDAYRGFVELVAGYIAAGVGSARSYQGQQQRAEELAELDLGETTFFSTSATSSASAPP